MSGAGKATATVINSEQFAVNLLIAIHFNCAGVGWPKAAHRPGEAGAELSGANDKYVYLVFHILPQVIVMQLKIRLITF